MCGKRCVPKCAGEVHMSLCAEVVLCLWRCTLISARTTSHYLSHSLLSSLSPPLYPPPYLPQLQIALDELKAFKNEDINKPLHAKELREPREILGHVVRYLL